MLCQTFKSSMKTTIYLILSRKKVYKILIKIKSPYHFNENEFSTLPKATICMYEHFVV